MRVMRLSKGKRLLILGAVLVVIDQVIKVLVKTSMSIGQSITVFPDWFQILFIENKGMAFGMSFGGVLGKYALTAFRIVLFGFLTWWISRLLKRGTDGAVLRDGKPDTRTAVPTGVLVGLTLITAGALGNIIDCLFYGLVFTESAPGLVATWGHYAPFMQGKVVDMFYFPLWTWPDWVPLVGGDIFFEPVFNFADSCVTVGAIYLILFQWKFFSKED
jgi:signal peptidase II